MSYKPAPDSSGTLKSINWALWILVFVFVILPIITVLCCCGTPLIAGILGETSDAINR